MNLGLLFLGNEPLSVLRSCAPRAEQAGFHGLYMVEAYRSAWAPLGLLASVTEKVRLGPYVLNVHAHSPWVTLRVALALEAGVGVNQQLQGPQQVDKCREGHSRYICALQHQPRRRVHMFFLQATPSGVEPRRSP